MSTGKGGPARVRATMFEVVDNQVRDGKPPATKQTLQRLMAAGHSRDEARNLIAAVLLSEMNDMLRRQRYFDETRYAAALSRLPELPGDDEDDEQELEAPG